MKKDLYLTKKFKFEASHNLPHHDGKCRRPHGHSWCLIVTVGFIVGDSYFIVKDPVYKEQGFLFDLSKLSDIVKSEVIDKFDHQNLNDFFDIPSAENVALNCYERIVGKLPESLFIESITLYETENSYVTWRMS